MPDHQASQRRQPSGRREKMDCPRLAQEPLGNAPCCAGPLRQFGPGENPARTRPSAARGRRGSRARPPRSRRPPAFATRPPKPPASCGIPTAGCPPRPVRRGGQPTTDHCVRRRSNGRQKGRREGSMAMKRIPFLGFISLPLLPPGQAAPFCDITAADSAPRALRALVLLPFARARARRISSRSMRATNSSSWIGSSLRRGRAAASAARRSRSGSSSRAISRPEARAWLSATTCASSATLPGQS